MLPKRTDLNRSVFLGFPRKLHALESILDGPVLPQISKRFPGPCVVLAGSNFLVCGFGFGTNFLGAFLVSPTCETLLPVLLLAQPGANGRTALGGPLGCQARAAINVGDGKQMTPSLGAFGGDL